MQTTEEQAFVMALEKDENLEFYLYSNLSLSEVKRLRSGVELLLEAIDSLLEGQKESQG